MKKLGNIWAKMPPNLQNILGFAGGIVGGILNSPAFTGTPTAPTAADSTNTTQLATTQFTQTAVNNAIAMLVSTSQAALDTLFELAAVLTGTAVFTRQNEAKTLIAISTTTWRLLGAQ